MKKEKILSTLEEIKVISDPFRLKILFLFDEENLPLTVKQMAVRLEEVASKVHYHVKEMERIGVLEIVETKEKAGIIEKYYYITAETFKVERSLIDSNAAAEHDQVGDNLFRAMQGDYERSCRLQKSEDKGTLNYGMYHLTLEEKDQLMRLIREFLEDKEPREDTKPYMFGYALFRKFEKKGVEKHGSEK